MNFVQADPGISSRYGGTGLGLAISKELVELMGGAIYVQSEEGVGSNFIIDIPFRLSENDGIETSLPAQESAAGINDTKYSILVAEDDSVNSRLIVTMLGKQGHRAAVAENGEEVINCLLKESFDAVLMDVEMPVMSGLEAVRLIRGGAAGEGITGIPVIALTAYVSADIEEKCLNAGMDRCLSKPVKIEELNSVFSGLIGSKGSGKKDR